MKYQTKYCTGFWLPDNPLSKRVDFYDVKIALDSWDEEEDSEDESIFYYMDGLPLEVGMVFVLLIIIFIAVFPDFPASGFIAKKFF
jgi:hypothetical protein